MKWGDDGGYEVLVGEARDLCGELFRLRVATVEECARVIAGIVLRQRDDIIAGYSRVYGEYIDFLEGELSVLYGLAFVHGHICSEEKVRRGEELRAAIRALKDKP